MKFTLAAWDLSNCTSFSPFSAFIIFKHPSSSAYMSRKAKFVFNYHDFELWYLVTVRIKVDAGYSALLLYLEDFLGLETDSVKLYHVIIVIAIAKFRFISLLATNFL